ncbi:hypothetical protein A9Q81_11660 [Gammaproteobacteria bacterium 42_54_T18]|nr:hypothetical protein A9Q81_11660 [Gammaproteobacteria bacterium 42_54_T18]
MAQAISILGVHYATIGDFLIGERDNDYGGVGPILEIPRGVVPAFTGNLQFRYGSATKYTFRAVAGDECVGDVTAGNLANIAIIDGGGFNLDFRNENINFENIYVHNFSLTTTGDSYDGLTFKGGVVDCYFYLKNSAPTNGATVEGGVIVLNTGDPESGIDKVVDISGSVPFHGLNTTVINKAGGVSGATGVIFNRSLAASSFNYVCVFSATNPSYVASGAGVPTGANNCAHDALMPGSVSDGVTAEDFRNLDEGDYRIEAESVPGLLGIGAHIQPIVNVIPALDTPLAAISIVSDEEVDIDLSPNYSDGNVGDTLTFTVSPDLPDGLALSPAGSFSSTGTQSVMVATNYSVIASDGHGEGDAVGVISIEVTAVVPRINNIDTDNNVDVEQAAALIDCSYMDVAPTNQVATLGGEALIIVNWNGGKPIVSIPLDINLRWGGSHQLSVTDDTGTVTLDNVILTAPADWPQIAFSGDIPEAGTQSLYGQAKTDATIGNYTMVLGDILVYLGVPDFSYDLQTIPLVDPFTDVSSPYKIWKEAEGSFTPLSTFEWTNDGLPADITAPIFQSTTALSGLNETAFNVDFASNEVGNYRLVVLPAGSPAPLASEVLAGTGSGGAVPLFASLLLSMTAGADVSTPATGFTVGTAFDAYVALTDSAGNETLSDVLSSITAAPNAAPVVTPPTGITISFANGSGGLTKTNAQLLAWAATASVTDDSDVVTVSADFSALPDIILADTYTITFNSTADSGALIGSATAQLIVTEAAGNVAPIFVSANSFSVIVGQQATHVVSASDADGDALTFSKFGSWPAGYLLVDNGNGTASITVVATSEGVQSITVRVNDGALVTDQVITVNVSPTLNVAPVFVSSASAVALEGSVYEYTPQANDANSDTVTYSLGSGPGFLSFVDGTLIGTPGVNDVAVHSVTVDANDGLETTSQTFPLTVFALPSVGVSDPNLIFDTPSFRQVLIKRKDDEANKVFQQDPLERNDYLIDVARYFEGDPILSVAWSNTPGITVTQGGANATQSVIWIEGGGDGSNYNVSVVLTSVKNRRKKVKFLVAVNEE